MGDLIVLEGKGELPTSWDCVVTRYFHFISNDHLLRALNSPPKVDSTTLMYVYIVGINQNIILKVLYC